MLHQRSDLCSEKDVKISKHQDVKTWTSDQRQETKDLIHVLCSISEAIYDPKKTSRFQNIKMLRLGQVIKDKRQKTESIPEQRSVQCSEKDAKILRF
jgi:hypothetical protein